MQRAWDDEKAEMTVPCEDPAWFDSSFVHDPRWQMPRRPHMSPRQMHETLEELKLRYGPNWGINTMQQATPRARGMSDADRRRLVEREFSRAGMEIPEGDIAASPSLIENLRKRGL